MPDVWANDVRCYIILLNYLLLAYKILGNAHSDLPVYTNASTPSRHQNSIPLLMRNEKQLLINQESPPKI